MKQKMEFEHKIIQPAKMKFHLKKIGTPDN